MEWVMLESRRIFKHAKTQCQTVYKYSTNKTLEIRNRVFVFILFT